MDAVCTCLPHVLIKILIHGILTLIADGSHPDKSKGNIICGCLAPVNISLPLGNADTAIKCPFYCFSVVVHINAIDFCPRRLGLFFRRLFKSRPHL